MVAFLIRSPDYATKEAEIRDASLLTQARISNFGNFYQDIFVT